jgi:hypothetical protein
MGKKLVELYDEAKKIGGFSAQMRMAILTMIPSVKAMEAMDSAENVSKFQAALITIRKEAGK